MTPNISEAIRSLYISSVGCPEISVKIGSVHSSNVHHCWFEVLVRRLVWHVIAEVVKYPGGGV